jgi:hypothetical protein
VVSGFFTAPEIALLAPSYDAIRAGYSRRQCLGRGISLGEQKDERVTCSVDLSVAMKAYEIGRSRPEGKVATAIQNLLNALGFHLSEYRLQKLMLALIP